MYIALLYLHIIC